MAGGRAPRAAGDRFERACFLRLKDAGWHVMRSAGSHGPADLAAFRADRLPVWVQCKITDNVSTRDRLAFYRIAEDAGVMAVIVSRPKGKRGALWVRIDPAGNRVPFDIGDRKWQS